MQDDLQVFKFNELPIRLLDRNGEPWWVAKDVAEVLGFRDAANAIRGLDADEMDTHNLSTPGGPQEMAIINEPGLYSLILRSRKPEARVFKRWVTHEVLPMLRRSGAYAIPVAPLSPELARGDINARPQLLAMIHSASIMLEEIRRRLADEQAVGLALPEVLGLPEQDEALSQYDSPLGLAIRRDGRSVYRLAKDARLHNKTIRRFLKGYGKPSPVSARKLSLALGVPALELFPELAKHPEYWR